MDILKALQEVLKKSVVHDGLFRGLNEVVKALDREALGEWAGLCKIDKEGNAAKVVGATSCVIKEFGESSPGYELLLEYLKESKKMETSNCTVSSYHNFDCIVLLLYSERRPLPYYYATVFRYF
ncbi:40S ribosomal protein S12 [Gracilariopsis chorda]|uniref:40S ribosomal protein S12 n=1 Tax=Gracilariopsis chorda TaxID=448386 RepID=A0A2V3ICI2_9FLOR|nr:40S ribosomal protein S12 [Gracilariopsis chorda]|eukprot:PXF39793.1 40S ribosomal protein S12 [Gracilariopsis chorda]